jgi:glycosyltransferase involved in cell wall biosynthesis
MKNLTTFIIPTVGRDTLHRAIESAEKQAPVLSMLDEGREGPSVIRNKLIEEAGTEWVSFLDDDDTVTEDYVRRLAEEIEAHPEAGIIHFKEYFLWGQVFPQWPTVGWGNIGISFSVKRELALKYPFKTEEYEDYKFVERIWRAGYKVQFSNYLVYRGRH